MAPLRQSTFVHRTCRSRVDRNIMAIQLKDVVAISGGRLGDRAWHLENFVIVAGARFAKLDRRLDNGLVRFLRDGCERRSLGGCLALNALFDARDAKQAELRNVTAVPTCSLFGGASVSLVKHCKKRRRADAGPVDNEIVEVELPSVDGGGSLSVRILAQGGAAVVYVELTSGVLEHLHASNCELGFAERDPYAYNYGELPKGTTWNRHRHGWYVKWRSASGFKTRLFHVKADDDESKATALDTARRFVDRGYVYVDVDDAECAGGAASTQCDA
jgi:hypothetical protein